MPVHPSAWQPVLKLKCHTVNNKKKKKKNVTHTELLFYPRCAFHSSVSHLFTGTGGTTCRGDIMGHSKG